MIRPTKDWERMRSAFRRLPRAIEVEVEAGTKRHIMGVKTTLEAGAKRNNFGLSPLAGMTKSINKARGRTNRPPLVGKSGGMINALEVTKTGNGWKLEPNDDSVGKVTWADIWRFNEEGAVIRVTDRMRGFLAAAYNIHLKQATKTLVIPARRILEQAVNRYLKSKAKQIEDERMQEQILQLARFA